MSICSPAIIPLNILGSLTKRPKTSTALAARISFWLLIGVGPKKMQKAPPGGQYPRSPKSTVSWPDSKPIFSGMLKYISSPQVFTVPLKGRACHIASATIVSERSASAVTLPTLILICLGVELLSILVYCQYLLSSEVSIYSIFIIHHQHPLIIANIVHFGYRSLIYFIIQNF